MTFGYAKSSCTLVFQYEVYLHTIYILSSLNTQVYERLSSKCCSQHNRYSIFAMGQTGYVQELYSSQGQGQMNIMSLMNRTIPLMIGTCTMK